MVWSNQWNKNRPTKSTPFVRQQGLPSSLCVINLLPTPIMMQVGTSSASQHSYSNDYCEDEKRASKMSLFQNSKFLGLVRRNSSLRKDLTRDNEIMYMTWTLISTVHSTPLKCACWPLPLPRNNLSSPARMSSRNSA